MWRLNFPFLKSKSDNENIEPMYYYLIKLYLITPAPSSKGCFQILHQLKDVIDDKLATEALESIGGLEDPTQ